MRQSEWEYSVVNILVFVVQDDLNRLGATGWEQVSVHPSGANWVCLLKRPKSSS